MPTIHGWEALVILAVVLIVFGVGKLPQVGGALGKGIREFRRGKSGLIDELGEGEEEEETPEPKKLPAKTKTAKKPAAKTTVKKSAKKTTTRKTKKKS